MRGTHLILLFTALVLVSDSTPQGQTNPGNLDVLYGATGRWNGGVLISIDPATAQATQIGMTGVPEITALAVNSAGEIFGSDFIYLHRIDGVTGHAQLVGFMGGFYDGLAFDGNDVLYTAKNSGMLQTVDTSTGEVTDVGDTGVVFGPGALTFDPTDGSLYMAHREIDAVYKVNPDTGNSFLLGFTEFLVGVRGLACDAAGFLYGVSTSFTDDETPEPSDSTHLILIDKTNGHGTVIGKLWYLTTQALALAPGVASGLDYAAGDPGLVLEQNEPNPFNPTTVVRFELPTMGRAELSVYNARGQRVRTLVDEYLTSGWHEARWDGRDSRGAPLASGVYLCRLVLNTSGGSLVQSRKMTLLK